MIVERQLPLFVMNNRELQKMSTNAGCYHCCKTFLASEVKSYTDQEKTALCPFCDIDAVIFDCIGFNLTEANLTKANKYWFAK